MEESPKAVLFKYYVEQTRHTEELRMDFTKFFSGLVSALAIGGAFLLQHSGPQYGTVVRFMVAGAGVVFCFLATATLWTYQRLIRQWVAAKDTLEMEYLQGEDSATLSKLREIRQVPIGKPVVVRYVAVLPFIIMGFLFLLLLLFPGLLTPKRDRECSRLIDRRALAEAVVRGAEQQLEERTWKAIQSDCPSAIARPEPSASG